jgi:Nucleotidyl transferase AbiEii toxin, Type IV TA system
MNLHYDILDEKRKSILPLLSKVSSSFYLAGGTALALEIGHRDSIDFDFFCDLPFDTVSLYQQLETSLVGHVLLRTQEESNTLGLLIDGDIRVSFMTYSYPLIAPIVESEYFAIAGPLDIGCMKLSAITSRSAYKDYVDLYFILQDVTLADLISALRIKMPTLEPELTLKSLVYFDDIVEENLLFKSTHIEYETIKQFLVAQVKNFRTV